MPSLLSPAEFRHPQASREVLLGDAVVAYALQRARRRTIGFTVGADGLAVRAPSWVTLGAVDAALREKSDWILRKLSEARDRQRDGGLGGLRARGGEREGLVGVGEGPAEAAGVESAQRGAPEPAGRSLADKNDGTDTPAGSESGTSGQGPGTGKA